MKTACVITIAFMVFTFTCGEHGHHAEDTAEKRQISAEQMAEMVSHLHDNNRPVQPLGDRQNQLVSR